MVALYRLALDWSLNALILGRAVELSTGNDEMGNVEMDDFWQDYFSLYLMIKLLNKLDDKKTKLGNIMALFPI